MKLDPNIIAANLSAAAAAEAEVAAAASQNNSNNNIVNNNNNNNINSSSSSMPMLTTSSSSAALASASSSSSSMTIPMSSTTMNIGGISNHQSNTINQPVNQSLMNQSQQSLNSGLNNVTTAGGGQHQNHHANVHNSSQHQTSQPNAMSNGLPSMVNKITPKDFQVVAAILKEMGITDYEPRVLPQLVEFAYRYVGCVLEDAQIYSSHARKKVIDSDDVSLAIQMKIDRSFVGPPSRDVLLEISRNKNTQPLPPIKSHNGMRLPADRYSLVTPNFRLVSRPTNSSMLSNNNIKSNSSSGDNKTIVRTVTSLLSSSSSAANNSSSPFSNSKISIQSPILASPTTPNSINQQSSKEPPFGKRKLEDIN